IRVLAASDIEAAQTVEAQKESGSVGAESLGLAERGSPELLRLGVIASLRLLRTRSHERVPGSALTDAASRPERQSSEQDDSQEPAPVAAHAEDHASSVDDQIGRVKAGTRN